MSLIDQFFTKKRHAAEASTQSAAAIYRQTLRDFCTGKESMAALSKLDAAAAAAGVSDQQMKADIERVQVRLKLRAEFVSRTHAQKELLECRRRMESVRDELVKHETEMKEQLIVLDHARRRCEFEVNRSAAAETELLKTCDDPEVLAERDRIREDRRHNGIDIQRAKANLTACRRDLELLKSDARKFNSTAMADAFGTEAYNNQQEVHARRVETAERSLANAESSLKALEQRGQDLAEAQAANQLRMLEV